MAKRGKLRTFFVFLCVVLCTAVAIGCAKRDDHTHEYADAWSYNDTQHWHECSCGDKSDVEAHVYDRHVIAPAYLATEATDTAAATYYFSCKCGVSGNTTFVYDVSLDEDHQHTFSRRNTDSKYLASAATADSPATYYFSCECGEKGSSTFEYGDPLQTGHTHKYDQKNTDSKYLASAATTAKPATYYYSCTCGEKGTETFRHGAVHTHSYSQDWKRNDTDHWHECSCGAQADKADHFFGCKVIDEKYLAAAATTHTDAQYFYSCECGEKGFYTFEYNPKRDDVELFVESPAVFRVGGDRYATVFVAVKNNDLQYKLKYNGETPITLGGKFYTYNEDTNELEAEDGEVTLSKNGTSELVLEIPGIGLNFTVVSNADTAFEATLELEPIIIDPYDIAIPLTTGVQVIDANGKGIYYSFTAEYSQVQPYKITCSENGGIDYHTGSAIIMLGSSDEFAYPYGISLRKGDTALFLISTANRKPGKVTVTIEEHPHNYTGEYKHDASGHWQLCSCGKPNKVGHDWDAGTVTKNPSCKEKGIKSYVCETCGEHKEESLDYIDHVYGTWVTRVAPKCTAEGREGHYHCDVCGKYFNAGCSEVTASSLVIPATGHDWATPVFTWAGDLSSATVAFTCNTNTEHTYSGNAVVTSSVTTDPGCTTGGVRTYTAKITLDGTEYKDTKTKPIDSLGHNYNTPRWTWNTSGSTPSVSVVFVCANDDSHTINGSASITDTVVSKTATCTNDGEITYTATAVYRGVTYTDTKKVTVPASGHSYGAPVYVWDSDYLHVTATRTCSNDASHTESERVEAACLTAEHVDPDCETDGSDKYESEEFENAAFTKQTKTVPVTKLGHDYVDITWTWTAVSGGTGYTAGASATCSRNSEHTVTISANVTSAVTKAATCEDKGERTYTAKVTIDGTEYQDTKTQDITALGHSYGDATYTWNDDNTQVTASHSCVRTGCDHGEDETKSASVSDSTAPTCEDKGSITYTSEAFATTGFEVQNKTVPVNETGHTYGELIAQKDATCTASGTIAHYNCSVCGKNFDSGKNEVSNADLTITALGHDYGDPITPVWTWTITDTLVSASAKITCSRTGCGHTESENAKSADIQSSVTTQPTCTAEGVRTYTAKVTLDGVEYSDSETRAIAALDHDWGEVVYDWNTDHTQATATRTCTRVSSHVETETVDSTHVTTPETCTDDGKTVYTATFTNPAFTTQTYNDPISKHAHDLYTVEESEPTYVDGVPQNGNYEHQRCNECKGYFDMNGNAISEEDTVWPAHDVGDWIDEVAATCTTAGTKGHYVCKLCNKNLDKSYNEITDLSIPAGHRYYEVERVAPTCEGTGTAAHYACHGCSKVFELEDGVYSEVTAASLVISETGHSWIANAVWTWTGVTAASAEFTCGNDGSHKRTVTAEISSEVTKAATCTETGTIKYTATVEFDGDTYRDSKNDIILALDHDYGDPVWTWELNTSTKEYTATVVRVCSHDSTHALTGTPTVTNEVTLDAKCTVDGERTYTATVTLGGSQYTDTKTQAITAPGHIYGGVTYEWSADYSTVTATHQCTRLGCSEGQVGHIESETKPASVTNTVAPGCETAGSVTYTSAAFATSGFAVQSTTAQVLAVGHTYGELIPEVSATCTGNGTIAHYHCSVCGKDFDSDKEETSDLFIDPIGHDYSVEWVWTEDDGLYRVTANVTCKRDSTHGLTINNVLVGHQTTKDATCTEKGEITYSAEITTPDGKKFSDTKKVETAVLGHNWVNIRYNWEADHTKVTAVCECSNDARHNHEETVNTTVSTTQPTCMTAGETVYTATFTKEPFETRTQSDPISALGHDYAAEWEWSFNGTGTANATATITCNRTGCEFSDTAGKSVEGVVTTAATCEGSGLWTYTVVITYDGREFTDTDTEEISATGHSWKTANADVIWAWTDITAATATFVCANDASHKHTVDANITSEITTPPTCEGSGVRTYTATVTYGGKTYTDTKTADEPAKGHTWNSGEITRDPTCTVVGIKTFTCTVPVCGATRTEDIDALGHTTVAFDGHPSTCVSHGNIAYWVCSVCDKYYSDEACEHEIENGLAGTDLPFAAHTLTEHAEVKPGCTTTGNIAYWTCSVCNKMFSDAQGETEISVYMLDAIGHKYDNHYDDTCNNCGQKRTVIHNMVWEQNGTEHWKRCDLGEGCTECTPHEEHDMPGWNTAKCSDYITCTVCGYRAHPEHNIIWEYNETYHWSHCTRCSHEESSDMGTHTFANGVCSKCGMHKIDAISFTLETTVTPAGSTGDVVYYRLTGCTDTQVVMEFSGCTVVYRRAILDHNYNDKGGYKFTDYNLVSGKPFAMGGVYTKDLFIVTVTGNATFRLTTGAVAGMDKYNPADVETLGERYELPCVRDNNDYMVNYYMFTPTETADYTVYTERYMNGTLVVLPMFCIFNNQFCDEGNAASVVAKCKDSVYVTARLTAGDTYYICMPGNNDGNSVIYIQKTADLNLKGTNRNDPIAITVTTGNNVVATAQLADSMQMNVVKDNTYAYATYYRFTTPTNGSLKVEGAFKYATITGYSQEDGEKAGNMKFNSGSNVLLVVFTEERNCNVNIVWTEFTNREYKFKVVDPLGNAVPDLPVYVDSLTATTDADGRVSFTLLPSITTSISTNSSDRQFVYSQFIAPDGSNADGSEYTLYLLSKVTLTFRLFVDGVQYTDKFSVYIPKIRQNDDMSLVRESSKTLFDATFSGGVCTYTGIPKELQYDFIGWYSGINEENDTVLVTSMNNYYSLEDSGKEFKEGDQRILETGCIDLFIVTAKKGLASGAEIPFDTAVPVRRSLQKQSTPDMHPYTFKGTPGGKYKVLGLPAGEYYYLKNGVDENSEKIEANAFTLGYGGVTTLYFITDLQNDQILNIRIVPLNEVPDKVKLSPIMIDDIDMIILDSDEARPPVYVRRNGELLIENTDYTLVYSDNKGAGTGKATVTGMGNYTGTVVKTFTIVEGYMGYPVLKPGKTALDDMTVSKFTFAIKGDSYGIYKVSHDQIRTYYDFLDVNGKFLGKDASVTLNAQGYGIVTLENNTGSPISNPLNGVYITISKTGTYTPPKEITLDMISGYSLSVEYTGRAITFDGLTVVYNNTTTLVKGTDYTVEYERNTAVGTNASVKIKGAGNYIGEITISFAITKGTLTSSMIWNIDDVTFDPNGNEPLLSIYNSAGVLLVKGTDYTVTFADNDGVGTATANVTGIGNYQGSGSKTFEIKAAKITDSMIGNIAPVTYNGSAHTPVITVTGGAGALTLTSDYTVDYTDNTDAGEATVTVTGTGNYTGTATKKFTIDAIALTSSMIGDIAPVTYTGSAHTPAVTVTSSVGTLTVTKDYTVGYTDNTNAGDATVTVTGTGNYKGSADKKFTINKATYDMSGIGFASASKPYNGNAQQLAITGTLPAGVSVSYTGSATNVSDGAVDITAKFTGDAANYNAIADKTAQLTITPVAITSEMIEDIDAVTYNGKAQTPAVTVTSSIGTLAVGTDYTVDYSDGNVNAGTVSVTVAGKGNYTSSAHVSFVINAVELTSAMISGMGAQEWTGSQIRPAVTVKSGDVGFREGYDYEIVYGANINRGEGSVTVRPIAGSNLKGSDVTVTFTITDPTSITDSMVGTIADCVYDGSSHTPDVVISAASYTLVKGKDYDLAYSSDTVNVGTVTVTISGKGAYGGGEAIIRTFNITPAPMSSVTVAAIPAQRLETPGVQVRPAVSVTFDGSPVNAADYTVSYGQNDAAGVGVGTVKITAKAGTNFTGEKEVSFDIYARINVTAAMISIASQTYTGSAITPVVVVTNGDTLTEGTHYTVAYGTYINANTYAVRVTGIGDYVGEADGEFVIAQKSIATAVITVNGTYTYTGSAITPEISVALDGAPLDAGNYTVDGENNTDAGDSAKVVITGTGNYTGSAYKTYSIARKSVAAAVITVTGTYTYTGSAITPEISVALDGAPLDAGNYTVDGENNVAVSSAAIVKITGKGNYQGTASKQFAIGRASIAGATITVNGTYTYTGSAITPNIVVVVGGNTLTCPADYAIACDNNVNAGSAATVTITGAGNYTDTANTTFAIGKADLADDCAVDEINPVKLVGETQLCPEVTVRLCGTAIADSNYTVDYGANNTAGKKNGSVTITAKDNTNFKGSVTVYFDIALNPISDLTIVQINDEKTYTGVALYLTAGEYGDYYIKDGDKMLTPGWHYNIEMHDNINEGKASMKLVGNTNYGYDGEVTLYFDIKPISIDSDNVEVGNIPSQNYTGEKLEPDVSITVTHTEYDYDEKRDIVTKITLTRGVDYEIDYFNNTNEGTAKATITGIRNIDGQVDRNFIIKRVFDRLFTMTEGVAVTCPTNASGVPYIMFATEGDEYRFEMLNNSYQYELQATADSDTTVTYNNIYNNYTLVVGRSGLLRFTLFRPTDIYFDGQITPYKTKSGSGNVGTFTADMMIGGGSAASDARLMYLGVDYDIARTGTYAYFTYTPTSSESISFVTTAGTKAPVIYVNRNTYISSGYDATNSLEDELVATLENPVPGTKYYIGVGNNGTDRAHLRVVYTDELYHKVSLDDVTVGTMSDITYTGSAITPDVSLEYDGYTLVKDKDYTLSYSSNNVGVGTVTVTVTGKGKYEDSIETTFKIVAAAISAAAIEDVPTQAYTGSAITPDVVMTYYGKELVKGTDYTLAYSANTAVGAATITITGIGNFTGTTTATFGIASLKNIADATITVGEQTYTGSVLTPVVTVTDGTALTLGTDYTLSYADGIINAGEYTVTVAGAGDYAGSVHKTFKVNKAALTSSMIANIADQVYEDAALTPAITVTFNGNTLVKDTDYTVAYSSNNAVGTGKVTITAKADSNFTGSAEKTFKIEEKTGDFKKSQWGTYSGSTTINGMSREVTVTIGATLHYVNNVFYDMDMTFDKEDDGVYYTYTDINNYVQKFIFRFTSTGIHVETDEMIYAYEGYDLLLDCTHDFATTLSKDATGHWYAATCGKHDVKKDFEAHNWEEGDVVTAATETASGTRKYICTVCGYEKIESYDHVHTYSDEWSKSDTHHWHEPTCSTTEKGSYGEHTWDEGDITHTATETENGTITYTCTTCGKTKDVPYEWQHEHTFDENAWVSDAAGHWHSATCEHSDQKGSYATHTENSGTEDGDEIVYSCTVCGRELRRENKPSGLFSLDQQDEYNGADSFGAAVKITIHENTVDYWNTYGDSGTGLSVTVSENTYTIYVYSGLSDKDEAVVFEFVDGKIHVITDDVLPAANYNLSK